MATRDPATPPKLLVFTGAGISADSGVPTFRDGGGLWENHSIDRVCNYLTWKSNMDEVHAFYNARRARLADVVPNEAHHLVARLQSAHPGTVIVTQNIDDLHERAGATDVLHVHGRLTEMKCEACGHVWDIGYAAWTPSGTCPRIRGKNVCGCRKGVKPNVIMFNEAAPNYPAMWSAFRALSAGDVLLVIGTSGQVIPVDDLAAATPATTILANLDASPDLECFDIAIYGKAAQTASRIEEVVSAHLGDVSENETAHECTT